MRIISKITRRNYESASLQLEGGLWCLTLDDARICTNEGRAIADASEPLMQHIAHEWQMQQGEIRLESMPLTRLLASLLDLTDAQISTMRNLIMEYVSNEMLAMRDDANSSIYAPILQGVEEFLSVKYVIHTQLIPPPQPAALLAKVAIWLEAQPAKTLLTHYVLTQTLGSFGLSVAALHLQLAPELTMQASWLEHDLQMQKWGSDAALLQKRNADATQLTNCLIFHAVK